MTGRCGKWGRPQAALSEATWIHPSSIAAAGCPSIFPHLAVPIFEANDFHCGRPSRVVFRQRPVMWTFQPEDLAASDSRRFRTAAESGRQRTPEFRTSSAPTIADRSPEVPVCPRGSRQGRFGVSPRTEAGESTGNPGVERGPPSGDRRAGTAERGPRGAKGRNVEPSVHPHVRPDMGNGLQWSGRARA